MKPFLPVVADPSSLEVLNLCNQLVLGEKCTLLQVEPVSNAVENECYDNVAKAISLKGGSIQYGWKIYEGLPGLMLEAEFHAVWVDSEGVMHEVSPASLPGMNTILFLPDSSRTYTGTQIDNVRIALRDDPLITDSLKNAEAYYEATNRGDLANQHGEITLTPEMKALGMRSQDLFTKIVQKFYT